MRATHQCEEDLDRAQSQERHAGPIFVCHRLYDDLAESSSQHERNKKKRKADQNCIDDVDWSILVELASLFIDVEEWDTPRTGLKHAPACLIQYL